MPSNGSLPADLVDEVRQVLDWADLVLDDWQESFLFDSLRRRPDGLWSAFEVAGVLPRQNGKGAIQYARQLVGLFVLGERLQVHTAHEFKTCSEHFLKVKELIDGSDELSSQVRIIRTGSGDQGIELRSGERIRFLARSRSSIRGFSADTIYFDEAFELPVATVGSVLPALSARPNPQAWYFSSAPHFESEFLHALLLRAESSDPGALFLRAWESPAGVEPEDEDAVRRVNPAMDIRIDMEFVRNERRTLCSTLAGVAEFCRERLGIREGGGGEAGVVPVDAWAALTLGGVPARMDSVMYGLSVSAAGDWSAIGSAGRLRSGELYVDSIEYRRGTGWVVDAVAELCLRKGCPIRVDPAGAEGLFVRPLRDAGVEVVEVSSRVYQQACGEVLSSVIDGSIRHLGQEALDGAVAAAGRRDVGQEGGWVWVRPELSDISPLKAATLALSGVAPARRAPRIHVLEEVTG